MTDDNLKIIIDKLVDASSKAYQILHLNNKNQIRDNARLVFDVIRDVEDALRKWGTGALEDK